MPKLPIRLPKKFTAKKNRKTPVKHSGPRRLASPKRIWYKPLTWRHAPPVPHYKPLPKARRIFVLVLKQLWADKLLFGGIIVIYGILNILLVRGLSGGSNVTDLKSTLDSAFSGFSGHLTTTLTTFTYLISSSGSSSSSATAGMYQSILIIITSLAFIWALRQSLANRRVRIRDAFYLGMTPLIPFILVFTLLSIQLLPLVIGGALYSQITSNGIAVHFWEKGISLGLFILLSIWSLRMITASIFALYIVTLPDMTPLRAYRSARQLVYGRRLLIWRKLIFLPLVLLLLAALIEVPLILFVTPAAVWVFFVLTLIALPILHAYLYNLYRELL
jgi:hypothetical protein